MEIHKVRTPTRYDKAPYGTLWRASITDDIISPYIQASKNENDPNWIRAAFILEAIFCDDLADPDFIEECLKQYEEKNT